MKEWHCILLIMSDSQVLKNKSQVFVRCLAVSICLLAGVLIAQVVILVRRKSMEKSANEDGEFVTTFTSCGFVKGLVQNNSYAFLGIPYATPPVGQNRWAKSELISKSSHCWNGTYSAVERKKSCWQFYRNGGYDGSEECLYLDVYTSKLTDQNPLDVIVFLGGESLDGGENLNLQPSAQLAKARNVVFVSVSIRRSVFGFLSLEVLSKRSKIKSSGNYGISDLLTALHWVKYNIKHFGGNLQSVTILGHQAGSTILGTLLRTGYYSNLFHRVWISGGHMKEPMSSKKADQENKKFLQYSKCETLNCLLNLSPEELMENIPNNWKQFYNDFSTESQEPEHNWLVYDGEILVEPKENLESHNNHKPKIPVVVGSPMHVDASPEVKSLVIKWKNTGDFKKHLETTFNTTFAIELYHQYFHPDLNSWQQISSLLSDFKTICPLLNMSETYFRANIIFSYITTYKKKTSLGLLAAVGSDIEEIFGISSSTTFKDIKFTENISNLFYSFVKTGSVHGILKKPIFLIDDQVSELGHYSRCDIWNRYINKEENESTLLEQEIPKFNGIDLEII